MIPRDVHKDIDIEKSMTEFHFERSSAVKP
jgi:hypothetical protein